LNVNPGRAAGNWPQTQGVSQGLAERAMTDNSWYTLIVGGIVAVGAIIFLMSGGDLGGKKTISGDSDLPPISTADRGR
jgi:hypothetical protein